jgi:hypothetical protein
MILVAANQAVEWLDAALSRASRHVLSEGKQWRVHC